MTTDYQSTRLWRETLASRQDDSPTVARRRDQLRVSYESFRDKADKIAASIGASYPGLTIHDVTHLDGLWDVAETIIGGALHLSPTEAFVLGGAFLVHDLGNGIAAYAEGIDELRATHEWQDTVGALIRSRHRRPPTRMELENPPPEIDRLALEETLRSLHARRAESLPVTEFPSVAGAPPQRLIDDAELRELFGRLVGLIASSHWWSADEVRAQLAHESLNPPPWGADFRTWTVDAVKVACLLRAADAAHLDSRRADSMVHALRRPTGLSALHWTFQNHLNTSCRLDEATNELVFTSGKPFAPDEAPAWWLCFDSLQMVDHELRSVDSVLARANMRIGARAVAGVESPARLKRFVKVSGWEPIDTKVHVTDVAWLVENLGGERLYGRQPHVPLRELVQNSADAIRARRRLERRAKEWGRIVVRLGVDGQLFVEVSDDGIGMSEEVLTRHLLDFGRTYWSTASARRELPGLLASDFEPTGRFGIGFFSVFSWADRVRVTTRYRQDGPAQTRVMEFGAGVYDRPLLRIAKDDERLDEPGTVVRCWLRDPDLIERLLLDNSAARGRRVEFPELLAWIAPTLDVDLHTVDDRTRGAPVVAVRSDDWQSVPREVLGDRLGLDWSNGADVACIVYSDGRVVGRGRPDPTTTCLVSIGGFRAEASLEIEGFSGILIASPTRADRAEGTPLVSSEELAAWATGYVATIPPTDPESSAVMADRVARLGGWPGPLAICAHDGHVLTAQQLADHAMSLDELSVGLLVRPVPLGELPTRAQRLTGVRLVSLGGEAYSLHDPPPFRLATYERGAIAVAVKRAWGEPPVITADLGNPRALKWRGRDWWALKTTFRRRAGALGTTHS